MQSHMFTSENNLIQILRKDFIANNKHLLGQPERNLSLPTHIILAAFNVIKKNNYKIIGYCGRQHPTITKSFFPEFANVAFGPDDGITQSISRFQFIIIENREGAKIIFDLYSSNGIKVRPDNIVMNEDLYLSRKFSQIFLQQLDDDFRININNHAKYYKNPSDYNNCCSVNGDADRLIEIEQLLNASQFQNQLFYLINFKTYSGVRYPLPQPACLPLASNASYKIYLPKIELNFSAAPSLQHDQQSSFLPTKK